MLTELVLLGLGWAPLWIVVALLHRKLRPGRLLLGALLAGIAGGMCAVELRRHGLEPATPQSLILPLLGVPLEEVWRYGLVGAAGALAGDLLLDRSGPEPQ